MALKWVAMKKKKMKTKTRFLKIHYSVWATSTQSTSSCTNWSETLSGVQYQHKGFIYACDMKGESFRESEISQCQF